LNGGAIFPLDLRTEASVKFADWIAREQITVYQSSPTAFRNLIGLAHESHDFSNLRLIRLDGESVYKSDVELYRGAFSSRCILVNSYSSTETGTISVYYIDKTSELSGTQAPAGYPVSGKEIFLLDSHGREVGTAGQGEVSVRSRFLAPGYWRRPELTAEKFLDDGTDGARSYRTGDFGQRAEPGCLELMGRKDFRVKIRNFSVDLGEIEGVLTTHPDVKHAAVIREHEVEPEPRIVAYIVPQNEAAPTASHLRRFVKERLPDYMIPSLFVFLGEITVLSSGKIDRRALPDPGRFRPNLDLPYCPPETVLERQLAEIWARVLSVEPIGIHDSFFDLGGHSLAATRIVSQIIRTLRVEIPPAILFGAPTVAQMALAISDHQCKKMHVGLEELIDQIEALREDEARDFVPRAREP
jgi:acyl-coenzyme A synthetase/AMP-(fatty) acid ligase/acyl carrier protein